MIQLKPGGLYGAISAEEDRFIFILGIEWTEDVLVLSIGGRIERFSHTDLIKVEMPIEKTTNSFSLSAHDSQGQPVNMILPGGQEFDLFEVNKLDRVVESTGTDLPEIIPSRAFVGGFSVPRKHYGEQNSQLIMVSGNQVVNMIDEYLFSGVVDQATEVTEFFEGEMESLSEFAQLKAYYKMHYLKPRLDLAISEYAGQPARAARLVDKTLLDLSSFIAEFPYQIFKELPMQVVVKKGDTVVAMKEIDGIVFKQLLMSGRYPELVEIANLSLREEPDEAQYSVQISAEKVTIGRMVELKTYDGGADSPRLISYKDGGDFVIEAIGQGTLAAISVIDPNDHGIELIQVVDMDEGIGEFRMGEGLVMEGMVARVSVFDQGWSPVTEIELKDITPDYAVNPQGINVVVKEREVRIGFDLPTDLRFAGTLLFFDGRVVRDIQSANALEITALEPGTIYVFEIAHYDIDGFESDRVSIKFETDPERTGPDVEPIPLYIDNILMNIKI